MNDAPLISPHLGDEGQSSLWSYRILWCQETYVGGGGIIFCRRICLNIIPLHDINAPLDNINGYPFCEGTVFIGQNLTYKDGLGAEKK